ncbi:BlaI/MecI/CopY family transcriptional regulator [Bacteroides fragilis]
MNEQKELTKAELQIMQVLWQKENAFVNEILQELEEPRPAYNTVSTVLRVLQNKGFVAYRSFGKNYQYYPLVSKESYTNRFMNRVVDNFFSGSVKAMVSFFTKKEEMSVQEIDELIEMLKENKKE